MGSKEEENWSDNEVNAGANSWSDDENEAPTSAGAPPTPVRVEKGGNSAPPSTRVKKMPKGNTWNAERPAPEPEYGIVSELSKWNPFATKATASVAPAAPAPGGAPVPMTPMPLPNRHKSILTPGANKGVSKFTLASPDSPRENASSGGSRKTRKTRKIKSKKSRKIQRTRRSRR